ncbi:RhoGAP-domain-containing protein [Patellaria atrata CBS 101060]|uniref:RhoGAP-domain-containing protein n=1 Tax=Patellaria atrata CBS 101060 TaxID=1346257 RepID=A0A9P4S6T6_9PEZI|nr:RhoGAP-domain-containing protein [Patellaria atrata CBS 101060]
MPPTQDRRPSRDQQRDNSHTSAPGDKPRSGGSRRPSGSRTCGKCSDSLTGQFVRALGDTYHLECFTCHDCGKIVASKFFPVPDQPPNQYPLCETDYFRRLDLLCYECGGALRGSYITALDRKYHIEHFTCSVCPTVFGAQDSYYEHEGNVYCHYHYSTRFAQRCNGCQTAILKQFVEIFRNGQNQHWHPECYMIHKYWNVRLHSSGQPVPEETGTEEEANDEVRTQVRIEEEKIEEKVLWIWRTLSAFEEKSATCISDMLLHVSNGAYFDGIMAAKKFIVHVDLLFAAADDLDGLLAARTLKGLSYSREAKLLCKKVVAFFQLLTDSQDTGVRRLGVTQELLSLVTGLAHYLKLLIRICLQGSLKLERETGNTDGLAHFLNRVNSLEDKLEQDAGAEFPLDTALIFQREVDMCPVCDKPVEDKCLKKGNRVFHYNCMTCQNCGQEIPNPLVSAKWTSSSKKLLDPDCASRFVDAEGGLEQVSRLRQYVFLLKVAHARLLATLRSTGALPHTSEDPNLADYDSSKGHRLSDNNSEPPLLRADTRSKSYAGSSSVENQSGSYEQTLGDIKRLRSTRLEKHLSTTMKRARSSRIIDGPEGVAPGEDSGKGSRDLQIINDRDANGEVVQTLSLGVNSMALDDIPRIVAAEQARTQRPNASKYARGHLIGQEPQPRLVNGHRRDLSGGQDFQNSGDPSGPHGKKKYFAELSALEYLIIRHVAVIAMLPLLDGQFNQEELLELIETKRPTFWGKFGLAFKNDKNKATGKKKVFGRTLESVVEKDGTESTDGVVGEPIRVPTLLHDAVSAMRTMDMSVEGVFRKNGNIRRLKEMSEDIDAKGADSVDLTKENPVQVAALLKKFLRELPDPVLTFKLHKLFITAARISDEDKRRRVLHLTCCLLPKTHRDTMEVLFSFLHWASSFHTVDEESGSKMDIHNLATVIAPNILYSNNKTQDMKDMDASLLAIEAVHCMIECNEAMCEVPEDLSSILNDSSLFENGGEITTKEILRRYGDIGKVPQPTVGHSNSTGSRTRGDRSSAPVVTRVDTNPHQWQNETSVRHVAGPGGHNYGPSSSQNTPPTNHYDPGMPNAPYANHPPGSTESYGASNSPNRHSQYARSPAFSKQGPMGVTGAG